jgi:hypothetical protein
VEGAPRKHLRFRLGAFTLGLASGIIAPLVLFGAFEWIVSGSRPPEFNVDVVTAGADVSRHGGRRVLVVNERGAVAQSCNGECDDLRLRENSGDNSYWVRVLDRSGGCVACTLTGFYVSNGYGASVTRVEVSGQDRLRARYLNADGTEFLKADESAKGPAAAE